MNCTRCTVRYSFYLQKEKSLKWVLEFRSLISPFYEHRPDGNASVMDPENWTALYVLPVVKRLIAPMVHSRLGLGFARQVIDASVHDCRTQNIASATVLHQPCHRKLSNRLSHISRCAKTAHQKCYLPNALCHPC